MAREPLRRGGWGIGLAFVIGVLTFFITFQTVKLWGPQRHEPLEPLEKRKPGAFEAPVFDAAAGDPNPVWKLQDQTGKVAVVNLFATWCPGCIEELPELKSLAREYAPRGVVFAALALDQDGERKGMSRQEVLERFLGDESPPFPILLPAADSILWKTQQIPIPQTFLYDRRGRSARVIVGSIVGRDVRGSIEELLKEP